MVEFMAPEGDLPKGQRSGALDDLIADLLRRKAGESVRLGLRIACTVEEATFDTGIELFFHLFVHLFDRQSARHCIKIGVIDHVGLLIGGSSWLPSFSPEVSFDPGISAGAFRSMRRERMQTNGSERKDNPASRFYPARPRSESAAACEEMWSLSPMGLISSVTTGELS